MKTKEIITNIIGLLKYMFKFAPEVVISKFIMSLIDVGLNFGFNVALIKIILDAIEKKYNFTNVLLTIISFTLLLLLSIAMETIYKDYLYEKGTKKVHKEMHKLVFSKVCSLDLEKYDDTNFYNDYIWALEKCDKQTISAFENTMKLFTSLLICTNYLALIVYIDKFLLFFIIIPIITNLIIGKILNNLSYALDLDKNPHERREKYITRIFYLKQHAKDLKSTNLKNILLQDFNDTIDKEINIIKRYKNKIIPLNLIIGGGTDVIQVAILYGYLAFKSIVQNAYTVGTCASMINTINQLSSSLNQIFRTIPQLYKNGIYAEKLFTLLNTTSNIETLSNSNILLPFQELRLNNVSFKYPNATTNALHNINLTIKKGEKIAFVGLNGAGKTTLIHLILHFYNPSSGQITYNGIDINKLTTKSYRSNFGVIFQDFQIYATSLLNNIFMDNISNINLQEKNTRGKECLKLAKLDNYIDNLDSMMTKEFDNNGLELSGGQKQKVAIARAFSNTHDIIIMDEASSSLDPISEHEINSTILDESTNQTTIIISHRLSTIRYVDHIYFFENGTIIEHGTHKELLDLNKKYAKMYETQAKNFKIP